MQPHTPGTQIMIRKPCPDCQDGFVKRTSDPESTCYSSYVVKLYTHTYCPNCNGDSWVDEWVSLETIARWLQDLV